MQRISDEDLASIRDYAADSFMSAPPPFKTVSGDILYLMTLELTALRNGDAIPMPVSKQHAEAMNLVSERWLKDNAR